MKNLRNVSLWCSINLLCKCYLCKKQVFIVKATCSEHLAGVQSRWRIVPEWRYPVRVSGTAYGRKQKCYHQKNGLQTRTGLRWQYDLASWGGVILQRLIRWCAGVPAVVQVVNRKKPHPAAYTQTDSKYIKTRTGTQWKKGQEDTSMDLSISISPHSHTQKKSQDKQSDSFPVQLTLLHYWLTLSLPDQQWKLSHIHHCGSLPRVILLINPIQRSYDTGRNHLSKKLSVLCATWVCVWVWREKKNICASLIRCAFECVFVITDGVWNPKLKQDVQIHDLQTALLSPSEMNHLVKLWWYMALSGERIHSFKAWEKDDAQRWITS